MILDRYRITFTREFEITVFAPEGTLRQVLEEIAEEEGRRDLDVYNLSMNPWESRVVATGKIELVSDERRLEKRKNGDIPFPRVLQADVAVLSDDQKEFVDPTDASWWLLTEEDRERERERERRMQDILHPDQMGLFAQE